MKASKIGRVPVIGIALVALILLISSGRALTQSDENGEPYLLEINSRMSGGLHKACMATQFPMPYWALRLALGTVSASEIPYPKTGVRLRKRKSYEME